MYWLDCSLVSSAVDRGLLSRQQQEEITRTGWLGIRIMCPSGTTCLSVDCCFCEIGYKHSTKHIGMVQSGGHHHQLKNYSNKKYSILVYESNL